DQVPKVLISDNGTQFNGKQIRAWCEDMKIEQHFVSVSHPHANGQVEVTNRIILNGLKMRLEKASGTRVDELTSVLWAYKTTPRSTGETPFSLVYGMEALLPIEVELQSKWSSTYEQGQNEELMMAALDTIEELREQTSTRVETYKQRMRASHDRKVKVRRFEVGDFVWKRIDVLKHGKFLPQSFWGRIEHEFYHLQQGNTTVDEYIRTFTWMCLFTGDSVNTDVKKARKFLKWLNQRFCELVGIHGVMSYADTMQRAQEVESYLIPIAPVPSYYHTSQPAQTPIQYAQPISSVPPGSSLGKRKSNFHNKKIGKKGNFRKRNNHPTGIQACPRFAKSHSGECL
ncbi:Unknown protein, partial [Striga hermonthica]